MNAATLLCALICGQQPVAASVDAGAVGCEIEGRVVGPQSEGVVEAKLVLYGADQRLVERTDTDQGGRFRIPAIAEGSYVLEVMAEGFIKRQQPLEVHGATTELVLSMEEARPLETIVRSAEVFPPHEGSSAATLTQRDIQMLPGGTSRAFLDAVATQQGVTTDNDGAIHVRGNFSGLLIRVDGIPLPASVQDRLQQLLESQIVGNAQVIVGGLPAEFGQQVGGVVDILTVRPTGAPTGEAQIKYGTYSQIQGQANAAGTWGPVSALVAGSLGSTDRGLDPPAASPILHDRLRDGRAFLRVDDALSSSDRLELLALYAEGHYQIPIDPTLLPLSDAPPNAQRGTDRYGNTPPAFIPYDSNPTQLERDLFGAVSWFHDFGPNAQLQVAPFVRSQNSDLLCDTTGVLGVTADPGSTCSDVHHRVLTGGIILNQTWSAGPHAFKAGVLANVERSVVGYSEYARDDAASLGGPNPSSTVTGEDVTTLVLAGAYLQDRISLGNLTLLPGLRADVQSASLEGSGAEPTLWGPSVRFGAAYAFSPDTTGHVFVGQLWQPPTLDAPLAARVLRLVPANQPVPFDLQGETDWYAEAGVATHRVRHLTVSGTAWGRLSRYTLDDNEVGDTALTADYNYQRGRAAGLELSVALTLGPRLRAFANATLEVAEGTGITTARYLFTPRQLAFTGYQPVDNAQLLSANASFDWADAAGTTHLSALVRFGSGLRTGPTNGATLPPNTVVDLTLRHQFDGPLRPELALDVRNLFDVMYAYRIATGSLAGSAYGPLREIDVRLIIPLRS